MCTQNEVKVRPTLCRHTHVRTVSNHEILLLFGSLDGQFGKRPSLSGFKTIESIFCSANPEDFISFPIIFLKEVPNLISILKKEKCIRHCGPLVYEECVYNMPLP